MAEKISPEFYLSLLSGRYGNVSHLSSENRDNKVGSHLPVPKFPKDPDLLDVLDALAAICVHNKKGDVFFVSLAMGVDTATLYVSTNGTVPATLTDHLRVIRRELKVLKSVLEPPSSPPPDVEFPDPNNTLPRTEGELKIQKIIYEYSYKKVQQRYQKRGPGILAQYDAITKSLYTNFKVVAEDIDLLTTTRGLLENIDNFLQDKIPQGPRFTSLIELIAILSLYWKRHVEAVEENDLLTQWDNLTRKSGLTSPIYDAIAHLLLFSCQEEQEFVPATIFREALHPSQPYTSDIAYRMVSPTFAYPRRAI